MSGLDDINNALEGMKISPEKKQPQQQRSSNIFLKKNFNSLAPKKKLQAPAFQRTPTKKTFNRDAFFSDSPMAVDDKRWNENKAIFANSKFNPHNQTSSNLNSQNQAKSVNIIATPLKESESLNVRENIQFHKSGFQKYSKNDSPFKDPYSSLNNKSIERAGASFLDNPGFYENDQKLAENLLKDISSVDDEKEIAKLKEEKIEEKDRKVKGLTINLLDHQVHGLKFLRRREKDKYINKGGMLCDDMGLGKTVQMIALIVKNRPKDEEFESLEDIENKNLIVKNEKVPKRKFKATLVICPVGLTTQWVQEIKRFAPHLKPFIYHGPNRPKSYKELMDYDVILTSYDTVRSDFSSSKNSPLYKGYWHRIVLDEAHIIKNKKSQTSNAVYNLESIRRWCLTGTPLQNSIDELQSLLTFLRVSMLSDENVWKQTIGSSLRKGKSADTFSLIKKELDLIMLRRTKKILSATSFKLPTKTIHRCEIEFSKMEQELYRDLKEHFMEKLSTKYDDKSHKSFPGMPSQETGALFKKLSPSKLGKKSDNDQSFYMYALVALLRLRQACCHWKLLSTFDQEDLDELNKASMLSSSRNEDSSPTKSVRGPSPVKKEATNIEQDLDDITNFMNSLTVKETKCEVCLVEKIEKGEKVCSTCHDKIGSNKDVEGSKAKKVVELLKKDLKRKTIIFSQFRELLLLLGPILKQHGIGYVTYDGSMNLKQKDEALDKLRTNPDVTVLLCSLKSGAVGLNLTVASQVIIYDPWWNPQIQEQAIDRVYRIGQTKPVDVYELAIKDSVEIGILKLQDVKRELAKAIINNDADANKNLNKLSEAELVKLFGLNKS